MRARAKRRQNTRRLLIIVGAVAVIAVIVGGIYILAQPSEMDKFVGKPVSSADIAALQTASGLSLTSYGSQMIGQVKNVGGQSLTSNGKPVVVYVGADYCPYCAVQRWGLILALMRFGTFSGLSYMTSNADNTDYATFSFHGATYQSNYIVFSGTEVYDRLGGNLDSVPAAYSSAFNTYGKGFPFLDFAGKYVVDGALLPPASAKDPIGYLNGMLAGKNFTQVISALSDNSSQLGNVIRGVANVISAAICKVTPGAPSSVCHEAQVGGLTVSLTSFSSPGNPDQSGLKTAESITPTASQRRQYQ